MTEGIKQEIDVLRNALKTDKGYYIAWQANIAMSFQDELARRGIRGDLIHDAANKAAEDFLELLIKSGNRKL